MNKKLIITLIIIFVLIGTSSMGYIIYDKYLKEEPVTEKTPNEEEKTEESTTENNNQEENKPTTGNKLSEKTYKVNYNNQEHQIKIESIEKETQDDKDKGLQPKIYYNIYIDNNFANTEVILGYTYEEDYEQIKKDTMDMKRVQIKTLNNSYPLIVLPTTYMKTAYNAYFYNNNKLVKKITLSPCCSSAGLPNSNTALTEISQAKFYDDKIQYYDMCTLKQTKNGTAEEEPKYSISYVTLTFDGKNINKKTEKTIDNLYAGGGDGPEFCE